MILFFTTQHYSYLITRKKEKKKKGVSTDHFTNYGSATFCLTTS